MPADNRSRAWCLTLNNPTDAETERLLGLSDFRYMILGKEVGENQLTPHIQGYIYWSTKKSLKQMKVIARRGHWEIASGSPSQNRLYCSKEHVLFEGGVLPKTRSENASTLIEKRRAKNLLMLSKSCSELVESGDVSLFAVPRLQAAKIILQQEGSAVGTDSVRGLWIHGPPGTGKSHLARLTYGDDLYLKAQNKWWCGYAGEANVLLDDFDCKFLGHYFKIWADKWPCTGEIKGGKVNLKHAKFIVTSNYTPEEIWNEEKDEVLCRAIRRRFEFKHCMVVYRDDE